MVTKNFIYDIRSEDRVNMKWLDVGIQTVCAAAVQSIKTCYFQLNINHYD